MQESEHTTDRNFGNKAKIAAGALLGLTSMALVSEAYAPYDVYTSRDVLVSATATALAETGKNDSFVEDRLFSREIFKKVESTTAILELEFRNQCDVPMLFMGTGFLVGRQDDTLYFATNRHVITQDKMDLTKTTITTPNKEIANKFSTVNFAYAVLPDTKQESNVDLAVIKMKVPKEIADSYTKVLPWQENTMLSEGEEVLAVGFPYLFNRDFSHSAVAGNTGKIKDVNEYNWKMAGIVSGGSSGSPVVENVDGEPVMIGMVESTNNPVKISDPNGKDGLWTYFNTLNGLSDLLIELGYNNINQ